MMRERASLASVLILCMTLLFAGCGKRITDVNLNQVKTEMTTKEVESILGPPTRVKSHEMTLQTQMKTLPATTYYYEQGGETVELRFVGDKLAPGGRNGSFGE